MNISRRHFCRIAGAGLAFGGTGRAPVADRAQQLRVIAYNVYGGTGWPKERKLAKRAVANGQMARRLAMELALHEPDIINFSESPNEELTKQIADLLEMNYVRFPSGGSWPGTLLSRFEITDAQNVPLGGQRPKELFTRHWGRGTIQLPGGKPLIVHSAHLYPTAEPSVRLKEIRAMLASMQADIDAARSMLLIGDLNHGPDTDEYKLWIDAGWVDTFASAGKGKGATIKSDIPKWRIDYVMASGPIAERIIESRPLFEGAFRLNLADSNSFALSDHLPQLAEFFVRVNFHSEPECVAAHCSCATLPKMREKQELELMKRSAVLLEQPNNWFARQKREVEAPAETWAAKVSAGASTSLFYCATYLKMLETQSPNSKD